MTDVYDAVLGTVGIEIETERVPDFCEVNGWRNTHDASCETPVMFLPRLNLIVARTPENASITGALYNADHRLLGREFVSQVFLSDDIMKSSVNHLLKRLWDYGEYNKNTRAGIHVHVGWSYDLETLKRTILLTAWTESLLFHLGGMGYMFRGIANQAAYCRPITSYGPPVVSSNIGNVQMTNMEALLKADSIVSFWNRFGGLDLYNTPRRYTPQRYMAVNLASVFFHKTLEFRMFNTTMNNDYIFAVVDLCKKLTRFTQSDIKFPAEVNSVYEVKDAGVNHNVLSRLCDYLHLESDTEEVLREILEESPVPTLKSMYVKSHLSDRSIHFRTDDLDSVDQLYPKISRSADPGVVDVHRLDNEIHRAVSDDMIETARRTTGRVGTGRDTPNVVLRTGRMATTGATTEDGIHWTAVAPMPTLDQMIFHDPDDNDEDDEDEDEEQEEEFFLDSSDDERDSSNDPNW